MGRHGIHLRSPLGPLFSKLNNNINIYFKFFPHKADCEYIIINKIQLSPTPNNLGF